MKRIVMVLAVVIFFIAPFVFAQSEHPGHEHGMMENSDTQDEQEGLIDIGNKICPVSGEEINEDIKATYEYEGKIYNFCCAMCIDAFKADPEQYIKKIEEEKASEQE